MSLFKRIAVMVTSVAVVAACVYVGVKSWDDRYELDVVMANAATIQVGTPVQVGGDPAGEVTSVEVRHGQAWVRVALTDAHAPMPSGTKAQVVWLAALGARVVSVVPGPAENQDLPGGSMIRVAEEQVEVDELLASLNPETRDHLASTLKNLNQTTQGRAGDMKALLKEAGPAVDALGKVLKAVGEDGHAIRSLVTNLRKMVTPLAERNDELGGIARDLAGLTNDLAAHHEQLGKGVAKLPATLKQAKNTLDVVPNAVNAAVPLLDELKPAAKKLPAVSKNLAPLLQDLRPAVADLRPTLDAANALLQRTPTLLDSAHAVLPGLTDTVKRLNPAVDSLRPYTPDLIGWLSNWGGAFAGYDAKGNFGAALARAGISSFDNNPGIATVRSMPKPPPGMASGNPWTDAYGSGMN